MAPVRPEAFSGKAATVNGGYSKRAYVTFLAGSGDYVKGVVGLAKGLRKVKSKYPLVVAVLDDVPEDHRLQLRNQGCIVRQIQPVNPPETQVRFAMAYYVLNYSKLHIWEFEEYSKMVYLDADIQVFDNIDNLFDMPDGYFYAVMDCFCEKTWSHSQQYKIGYCQQCPDKVTWPAELGQPPALYFNAGMFVFEPSKVTYNSLMESLRVTPPTPFAEQPPVETMAAFVSHGAKSSTAPQDSLNMFFQKIYRPIPLPYNLVLAMLWRHPENVDLEGIKVVQYRAAGSKPWRFTGKEENMDREDVKMLVNKWRAICNDSSLDFKSGYTILEAESRSDLQQITVRALGAAMARPSARTPAPPAA